MDNITIELVMMIIWLLMISLVFGKNILENSLGAIGVTFIGQYMYFNIVLFNVGEFVIATFIFSIIGIMNVLFKSSK